MQGSLQKITLPTFTLSNLEKGSEAGGGDADGEQTGTFKDKKI